MVIILWIRSNKKDRDNCTECVPLSPHSAVSRSGASCLVPPIQWSCIQMRPRSCLYLLCLTMVAIHLPKEDSRLMMWDEVDQEGSSSGISKGLDQESLWIWCEKLLTIPMYCSSMIFDKYFNSSGKLRGSWMWEHRWIWKIACPSVTGPIKPECGVPGPPVIENH